MSKKLFSDEEINTLLKNPFTLRVTHNILSFTKEFKELFLSEYNAGRSSRQILIEHGYDPEMLGKERIWGITHNIRKQYKQYGEVYERVPYSKSHANTKPLSDKDELKKLRHEVDYMKQEIEFLKKISSIRNTGK